MKRRLALIEVLEAHIAPTVDLVIPYLALTLPVGGVTVPGASVGVAIENREYCLPGCVREVQFQLIP